MKMTLFLHLDKHARVSNKQSDLACITSAGVVTAGPLLTFGIIDICVQVNSSKSDGAESLVHNVSKLTCLHWTRDTANEHCFAWIRCLFWCALAFAVCNEPRSHFRLQ